MTLMDQDTIVIPDETINVATDEKIEIDIKMGVDEIIPATFVETENVNAVLENPVLINNPSDYSYLNNKPSINGVELSGNKSLEDLNVIEMTNFEIENILQRAFSN